MSGIYIHIPFCRKACHYCNFHFSTSLRYKEDMVSALITEIHLRADELPKQPLRSIYFGGGTPSVLNRKEIDRILAAILEHFSIAQDAEITLEANPDDLTTSYLQELSNSRVNRFSIGIQSLRTDHLEWMNRSHSREQALHSVQRAQELGFEWLTVDWIYGFPALSNEQLIEELNWTANTNIPHFSAYSLTIEPKTVFAHRIQKGQMQAPPDQHAKEQFDLIMEWAQTNGYEHYEISNFGKPGHQAVHNSSYWKGHPYLGIGPAAHSYDGHQRRWNVANNQKYLRSVKEGQPLYSSEVLSSRDRWNEGVMTGLRLQEGLDLQQLSTSFPQWTAECIRQIRNHSNPSWWDLSKDRLRLTRQGKHFADRAAADLFI